MKSVKIAELKDRLSEHLRAVEQGKGEVVITDRNRPIARIVPIAPSRALTVDRPKVSFAQIRTKKWRASRWKISSSDLLVEERSER